MERALLWTFAVVAVGAQVIDPDAFVCPSDETTGKFPHDYSCDVYWNCFRGEATKVKCADGLAFDPNRVEGLHEPCDYIFKVNCTGREELQDPVNPTASCPRQNGIFPHENDCGKYYSCKGGKETEQLCPPGLHFSLVTKTCAWPAEANRETCNVLRSIGDFTCDPSQEYFTPHKQKIVHPKFPHDDCRKFYVCKNGIDPAISSCNYGLVYNIDKATCDDPINVPDCETYYEELEAAAGGEGAAQDAAV